MTKNKSNKVGWYSTSGSSVHVTTNGDNARGVVVSLDITDDNGYPMDMLDFEIPNRDALDRFVAILYNAAEKSVRTNLVTWEVCYRIDYYPSSGIKPVNGVVNVQANSEIVARYAVQDALHSRGVAGVTIKSITPFEDNLEHRTSKSLSVPEYILDKQESEYE